MKTQNSAVIWTPAKPHDRPDTVRVLTSGRRHSCSFDLRKFCTFGTLFGEEAVPLLARKKSGLVAIFVMGSATNTHEKSLISHSHHRIPEYDDKLLQITRPFQRKDMSSKLLLLWVLFEAATITSHSRRELHLASSMSIRLMTLVSSIYSPNDRKERDWVVCHFSKNNTRIKLLGPYHIEQ